MVRAAALTFALVLTLTACSPAAQEPAPPTLGPALPTPIAALSDAPVRGAPAPASATAAASAERMPDPQLVEAARGYASFSRVGDLALAPTLCAAPVQPGAALMAPARLSRAASPSGHAEKVFWVFTQDRAAYLDV